MVQWDQICVQEAAQQCGGCGMCQPNGTNCSSPAQCCSGTCNANGKCGGMMPCPHDPCVTGAPLGPQCGACANNVCQNDPFCCQNNWDAGCVAEAEQLCGLDCGMCNQDGQACMVGADCCSGTCNGGLCVQTCQPDGQMCSTFADCCSNNCSGGVCGGMCQPDGSFCQDGSGCCSGTCVLGFCGFSQCPSDGSTCGDCVAENCCSQIQGCFGSPDCVDDFTCFIQCVQGGSPVQCLLQCVNDPQAFQALLCLGQNCGPGTCF